MANIKDIIDELKTIADAFTSVKTFIFDNSSSVNIDPTKDYPVIHVNSLEISTQNLKYGFNNLPVRKSYTLTIMFYDSYPIEEQKTKDLQTKYGELQVIIDQFFAKLIDRVNEDSVKGFILANKETITGTLSNEKHNDKLVVAGYTAEFWTYEKDCTTGIFNF